MIIIYKLQPIKQSEMIHDTSRAMKSKIEKTTETNTALTNTIAATYLCVQNSITIPPTP
jgi:hypothetical protein